MRGCAVCHDSSGLGDGRGGFDDFGGLIMGESDDKIFDDVLNCICEHMKIDSSAVLYPSFVAEHVLARRCLCFVMSNHHGWAYTQTAGHMGKRNHSGVVKCTAQFDELLIAGNDDARDLLSHVEKELELPTILTEARYAPKRAKA